MLGEKQRAVSLSTAPRCGIDCESNHTTNQAIQSSNNLKEQIETQLSQMPEIHRVNYRKAMSGKSMKAA